MRPKLLSVSLAIIFIIMSSGVCSAAAISKDAVHQKSAVAPAATASGSYNGFDLSSYPGDTQMSHFWTNTPFYFTGFYLAPAPWHSNTSWMSKRSYLEGLGYGLLVLYVGRQAGDTNLTYAQGQTDGANAKSLASSAGFSTLNTVVYLDIEQGGTLSSSFINYIDGWIDYIAVHSIYMPGIYCSYQSTANQIRNSDSYATNDCIYYNFNINEPPSPGNTTNTGSLTPASCGVSYAGTWQYNQNGSQTWNGTTLNVDLDLSNTSNPSSTR